MSFQRLHRFGTQIIFLSFMLGGCGYTTHSLIADKFTTIYVVPFVNKIDITPETDTASKYKIYKPMLETDITRSVINKFLSDGNLRPVDKKDADLLLKGELMEFRRDPLRYTQDDEVQEYRVNLVVNFSLVDNKTQSLIFQERNFTGHVSYFISGILARTEDAAINEALDDLARRIVERVVEQW